MPKKPQIKEPTRPLNYRVPVSLYWEIQRRAAEQQQDPGDWVRECLRRCTEHSASSS